MRAPTEFSMSVSRKQNMIGVAAGMARAGLVPFASTFSVFASLRAADQSHTDICYQNVNAKNRYAFRYLSVRRAHHRYC
ncbi:MAG: hypothetical protein ACLTDA_11070 [[Eubacterium] siraeum]